MQVREGLFDIYSLTLVWYLHSLLASCFSQGLRMRTQNKGKLYHEM